MTATTDAVDPGDTDPTPAPAAVCALSSPPEPGLRGAYGGKAAGLFELAASGQTVPPGIAVAPSATVAEILAAVPGSGPWIVRSSALAEDSREHSFAGLFESLGGCRRDALPEAIARVRASGRAARVRAYRKNAGLDPDERDIPIVIQEEIQPAAAGVAFTLHPTTGREQEMLVEACFGHGEALVSGSITPWSWVLRRRDGAVLRDRPGDPRPAARGPGRASKPKPGADEAPLDAATLRRLWRHLREIQAARGAPVDVEWAFDGEQLFFVQARPITRISAFRIAGEWTSADFRDGGVAAGVCAPLMAALYETAVRASMTAYFRTLGLLDGPPPTWMVKRYGRGYWNSGAVKENLGKLPGFDERDFDLDLGITKDYGPEGPRQTPTTLATVLPALPVAAHLELELVRHRLILRQALRITLPRARARLRERLLRHRERRLAGGLETAAEAFREAVFALHPRTEQLYFRTIYNSTTLQGEFKTALDKAATAAGIDPPPSLPALFGGLGEVAHLRAERDLHALMIAPEDSLEAGLEAFLAEHGYRGTRELDLTVPRWSEDPSFVREIVRQGRDRGPDDPPPRDPALAWREQRRRYLRERDRVADALPWLDRLRFRVGLARVRDYLRVREEMRDASTRAYALVREAALVYGEALAAAGRIERREDIFLLRPDEALLDDELGRPDLRAIAHERRLDDDGFRDFDAPHEFGEALIATSADAGATTGDVRRGIPCSPGQVEAPAFVADSLAAAAEVPDGAILVTAFTDPGWTPLFRRLAGVVTEVGGLLSHAAVLSREFGIPAVLAVPGARRFARHGERLQVDGDRGEVRHPTAGAHADPPSGSAATDEPTSGPAG